MPGKPVYEHMQERMQKPHVTTGSNLHMLVTVVLSSYACTFKVLLVLAKLHPLVLHCAQAH